MNIPKLRRPKRSTIVRGGRILALLFIPLLYSLLPSSSFWAQWLLLAVGLCGALANIAREMKSYLTTFRYILFTTLSLECLIIFADVSSPIVQPLSGIDFSAPAIGIFQNSAVQRVHISDSDDVETKAIGPVGIGGYWLSPDPRPAVDLEPASLAPILDLSPYYYDFVARRRLKKRQRTPPLKELSTISVIVISHNEHRWVKLTVDSIIEFTNPEMLLEIILVDDYSVPPHFPADIDPEDYGGLVTIIRNDSRMGLIQSRQDGANSASGDVLVFLDCHVKPIWGWEEEIIRRISRNYREVVVPAIPMLDEDWTQKGTAVGFKMMMEWDFAFHWFEDGNDEVPIMSGGLFGMSRDWWHESGEYDRGMLQWGSENIEQSIRIWLCHGEVSVARDSRILHLFRSSFPYKLDTKSVQFNKARTVQTWWDSYKSYSSRFVGGEKVDVGDISERLKLRKVLDCNNFDWFVERFREVFESRGMIHSRTIQMAIVSAKTENPPPIVMSLPDLPPPPIMSSSAVTGVTSDHWCLLPVQITSDYIEHAINSVGNLRTTPQTLYDKMAVFAAKSERNKAKVMTQLTKRNVGTGVTLAPCNPHSPMLNWRHASATKEALMSVAGPKTKTNDQCLQMSREIERGNVTMGSCAHDHLYASAEHKANVAEEQTFRWVNPYGEDVSSLEDFSDVLAIGPGEYCITGRIPTGFESGWNPDEMITPVINMECQTQATGRYSSRFAQVNQAWIVHRVTSYERAS